MNEQEILVSRLVDRAIRPCIPSTFTDSIQININLISSDETVLPDTLAGLAASAALMLSDVPFDGPLSEVRVARINGKLCINPTPEALEQATIDMIVACSHDRVLMVEGAMQAVSEQDLVAAIGFAQEAIGAHCTAQNALAAAFKKVKPAYTPPVPAFSITPAFIQPFYEECYEVVLQHLDSKKARKRAFKAVEEKCVQAWLKGSEVAQDDVPAATQAVRKVFYQEAQNKAIRQAILGKGDPLGWQRTRCYSTY